MSDRKQIAVIDDESDIMLLFSGALIAEGFHAIGFDNPVAAVEYIKANHEEFRLAITDWKMPGMNGFEFTKIISDVDDEIIVMLMSGYDLKEYQLKQANIDHYLKKPMHITNLIDSVKRELR